MEVLGSGVMMMYTYKYQYNTIVMHIQLKFEYAYLQYDLGGCRKVDAPQRWRRTVLYMKYVKVNYYINLYIDDLTHYYSYIG